MKILKELAIVLCLSLIAGVLGTAFVVSIAMLKAMTK